MHRIRREQLQNLIKRTLRMFGSVKCDKYFSHYRFNLIYTSQNDRVAQNGPIDPYQANAQSVPTSLRSIHHRQINHCGLLIAMNSAHIPQDKVSRITGAPIKPWRDKSIGARGTTAKLQYAKARPLRP
jgi:hypothetical protein